MVKIIKIVNAIILQDNKILTIKRGKEPYKEIYGLPGGHVDKNETNKAALIRELYEETGYVIDVVKYLGNKNFSNHKVYFYSVKIKSKEVFICNDEILEVKWLSKDKFIKNLESNKLENINYIKKLI